MKYWILIILFSTSLLWANDGLKVGDSAPTFSLPQVGGDYFFLRDVSGPKLRKPWKNKTKYVVVMSFFATWCVPCQKEIPHLEEVKKQLKDAPVKIMLVDVGEKPEVLDPYLAKKKPKLPVLADRYQMVSKKYNVKSLPTMVVIDKQGNVRRYSKGFKDDPGFCKELFDFLSRLAAE